MQNTSGTGPLTLIRSLVEEIPVDKLGIEGSWDWDPSVPVDTQRLGKGSPTTEYSSQEDNE